MQMVNRVRYLSLAELSDKQRHSFAPFKMPVYSRLFRLLMAQEIAMKIFFRLRLGVGVAQVAARNNHFFSA